jgi:hypothetical protein
MTIIKSFIISFIDTHITSEYIANVLWNQHIAQVRGIILVPYLRDSVVEQIAYVDINHWCDSEVAYNFRNRLTNPDVETRIVHRDEEWWVVKLNPHNNACQAFVSQYITSFNPSYFEREIPEEDVTFVSRELDPLEFMIEETVYGEEDLDKMEECVRLIEYQEYEDNYGEVLGEEEEQQPDVEYTLECYYDPNNVQEPNNAQAEEEDDDWLTNFLKHRKNNVTLRPHQFKYGF